MTPKEKAAELVGKYIEVDADSIYDGMTWDMARQCALICVEEMELFYRDIMRIGTSRAMINYLEEIKKEINK